MDGSRMTDLEKQLKAVREHMRVVKSCGESYKKRVKICWGLVSTDPTKEAQTQAYWEHLYLAARKEYKFSMETEAAIVKQMEGE